MHLPTIWFSPVFLIHNMAALDLQFASILTHAVYLWGKSGISVPFDI